MKLSVVATGVANLASVAAAMARLGAAMTPCDDAAAVLAADALVLPGVGQFGAAMAFLRQRQLLAALRQRLRAARPTLGICLGMQLCCEGSAEAPRVPGLGVVPGRLQRFPEAVRVPQMGWNDVVVAGDTSLLRSGAGYFANSFRLAHAPAGWSAATAEHGGRFVAALENGPVLLCQFHPELSGCYGHELLRRWLERSAAEVRAC